MIEKDKDGNYYDLMGNRIPEALAEQFNSQELERGSQGWTSDPPKTFRDLINKQEQDWKINSAGLFDKVTEWVVKETPERDIIVEIEKDIQTRLAKDSIQGLRDLRDFTKAALALLEQDWGDLSLPRSREEELRLLDIELSSPLSLGEAGAYQRIFMLWRRYVIAALARGNQRITREDIFNRARELKENGMSVGQMFDEICDWLINREGLSSEDIKNRYGFSLTDPNSFNRIVNKNASWQK